MKETHRQKIKRWARFGLLPHETMNGEEYWEVLREQDFQMKQDYLRLKIKEYEISKTSQF
jgi:hypothetical protein